MSVLDIVMGKKIPKKVVDAIAKNKRLMGHLRDEVESGCSLTEAIVNCLELEWDAESVRVYTLEGKLLAKLSLKGKR